MKLLSALLLLSVSALAQDKSIGVKAPPIDGAEMIIDGTRAMLDSKWTYWQGPRFASSLPIKWKIVEDPVDGGTALMTDDRAADGGKYGCADIVTNKTYRDFRLHVEFIIMKPRGNSGVYLQNRYEIQIMEGDRTKHGLGAVINETDSPYDAFNGLGKWNAYDINFRAARFKDGQTRGARSRDYVFQWQEGAQQRGDSPSLGRPQLRRGWWQRRWQRHH